MFDYRIGDEYGILTVVVLTDEEDLGTAVVGTRADPALIICSRFIKGSISHFE